MIYGSYRWDSDPSERSTRWDSDPSERSTGGEFVRSAIVDFAI